MIKQDKGVVAFWVLGTVAKTITSSVWGSLVKSSPSLLNHVHDETYRRCYGALAHFFFFNIFFFFNGLFLKIFAMHYFFVNSNPAIYKASLSIEMKLKHYYAAYTPVRVIWIVLKKKKITSGAVYTPCGLSPGKYGSYEVFNVVFFATFKTQVLIKYNPWRHSWYKYLIAIKTDTGSSSIK